MIQQSDFLNVPSTCTSICAKVLYTVLFIIEQNGNQPMPINEKYVVLKRMRYKPGVGY